MFHYPNRMKNVNQPLVKIKSSYDKLDTAMSEPVREHNAIKELVEAQDNNITNIKNKKKDLRPLPPKQKNIRIKKQKIDLEKAFFLNQKYTSYGQYNL